MYAFEKIPIERKLHLEFLLILPSIARVSYSGHGPSQRARADMDVDATWLAE